MMNFEKNGITMRDIDEDLYFKNDNLFLFAWRVAHEEYSPHGLPASRRRRGVPNSYQPNPKPLSLPYHIIGYLTELFYSAIIN